MATASEQISSAAVSAPPASRPATKLKRVLVVDKPRFSALVQRMLTGRFDVVCVEDVVEARLRYDYAGHYNRPDVFTLTVRSAVPRLFQWQEAPPVFPQTSAGVSPEADLEGGERPSPPGEEKSPEIPILKAP